VVQVVQQVLRKDHTAVIRQVMLVPLVVLWVLMALMVLLIQVKALVDQPEQQLMVIVLL
jgi:hypothetical protein